MTFTIVSCSFAFLIISMFNGLFVAPSELVQVNQIHTADVSLWESARFLESTHYAIISTAMQVPLISVCLLCFLCIAESVGVKEVGKAVEFDSRAPMRHSRR